MKVSKIDSIPSNSHYSRSTIVTPYTFFVIIDSKDNRRICSVSMGKLSLNKHHSINLNFFLGKELNTFWEYDDESKQFNQINSNIFHKEDLSK